jgi:predicted nucleic acid-binding protein
MDTIFVDTGAWYALANEKDINHLPARQFLTSNKRLVTSNFVCLDL